MTFTDDDRLLLVGAADKTVDRLGPAPYPADSVGWWSWLEEYAATYCVWRAPTHKLPDTPPPCAGCRWITHTFVREAQGRLANVPPGPEVPGVETTFAPSGFPPAADTTSGTNMADGPGGSYP